MVKYKLIISFLILFIIGFSLNSFSQKKYVIYLKDKANTSYNLSAPLSMISQRALDRRTKQVLSMDSTDIPVNQSYIDQVELKGAQVIRVSKWLNALVIDCDSIILDSVLALNFVESNNRIFKVKHPDLNFEETPIDFVSKPNARVKKLDYGSANNQILMLGADEMHDDGYTGAGVWVGVFDAGFRDVNTISHFAQLRNDNRILGTYDIVDGDSMVYDAHTHGTAVLSCMTAYTPGQIIGSGFGASYVLFRTEDVSSETQLEEFNWLVAAEMADSMGVDIINTSLGYTSMDNSQFSHTYADMDGFTTIISKAATIASRKGMLCVNSAGNDGDDPWFFIGAPADSDSILTVGAVQSDSVIAGFSSRGPTSDGRIKPNVVAQGQSAAIVSGSTGNVATGSGTSFSSPIMAGFVAGLWQAFPNLTNHELIALIQMSANNTTTPNNDVGFGIPNYGKAKFLSSLKDAKNGDEDLSFYPNPYSDGAQLKLRVSERMYREKLKLSFYNLLGQKMDEIILVPNLAENILSLESGLGDSNFIIIHVESEFGIEKFKLIKD
jgi:serine protease AprX